MRLLTLTSLLATAVLATARSLPPSKAFGNNGQGGHGDSGASTQVTKTTAAAALSTAAENVAAKSTATAKTTTKKTSSTKKTSTSTSAVAAVASSSSASGSSSGTSRTTAPDGALTVGSSGTYSTIQDAVDALDTSTTTAQSIFIESGTYSEQVTIPELASALSIYGYTEDTSSYSSNVVSIEHSYSLDDGAADDKSTGTLINLSANTAIYNIDIKNTYGEGSQAIALSAYNSEQGYYGVGLYGYQDTLLAETGTQFYGNCYIEGAVDFIFGQEATIWIEGSTIAVSAGGGSITANGRTDADGDSYYVINNSEIAASSSGSVTASSVYLGRPWSEYARVAFQNSQLSDIINSAGWAVWSTDDERTDDVTFETYANTGDGATDCCTASFATELSAAIDITTILGSDYADWVDSDYYS